MPGKPTPAIPDGGLFGPVAEAKINASPQIVYDAIVNTSTWPDWNTFVPGVDINSQPGRQERGSDLTMGTQMTFHVTMTPSFKTTNSEIVTVLGGPPKSSDSAGTIYTICWANESSALVPKAMLAAERVNEIEVCEDGTCIYRTWESFTGPIARLVKWKFESVLQARFEDWARDLKQYAENVAKAQSGGSATL